MLRQYCRHTTFAPRAACLYNGSLPNQGQLVGLYATLCSLGELSEFALEKVATSGPPYLCHDRRAAHRKHTRKQQLLCPKGPAGKDFNYTTDWLVETTGTGQKRRRRKAEKK